jgi:hypothetical protein
MKKRVLEAAKLFVTDRTKFQIQYADNPIVGELLEEVFLESESRPELCERIPIILLGHVPSDHKRGYDGVTKTGRPIELKARNYVSTNGEFPRIDAGTMINDVSDSILERYQQDNPLMLFPYFFDGHLAAIFSVDYSVINHRYQACLEKTHSGRKSFKLASGYWINECNVEFVHSNPNVQLLLPRALYLKAQKHLIEIWFKQNRK